MLCIALPVALLFGMIGFAKAWPVSQEDGGFGARWDADFWNLIRDSIMAAGGVVTSVVPMVRSPRKNSAYAMAWFFSVAAILLCVLSIGLYSRVNKCWSSACTFLMQYATMASLVMLGLDEVPKGMGESKPSEGKSSREKKDQ
jgi:hypothetical protein